MGFKRHPGPILAAMLLLSACGATRLLRAVNLVTLYRSLGGEEAAP